MSQASMNEGGVEAGWRSFGFSFLPEPSRLWNRAVILASILVLLYTLNLITILLGDYWLLEALGLESVFWTNFRMGAILWISAFVVFAAAAVIPAFGHDLGRSGRFWAISPGILLSTVAAVALCMKFDVFLLGSQDVVFDQVDPVFGRDLGFYVFKLPYMWVIWKFAMMAVAVNLAFALLCSVAQAHQSGRLGAAGHSFVERVGVLTTLPVRIALVIGGVVTAVGVWLSRYDLLIKDNSSSSVHIGADYVDVTGLLSNLNFIYLSVLVVLGLTVVVFLVLSRWHLDGFADRDTPEERAEGRGELRPVWIGAFCLVLAHFGFKGGVELRDAMFVKPNEPVIQLDFIERHIEATRQGAKLGDIERVEYRPNTPDAPLPPIDELLQSAAVRNAPLWPGFSSYLERLLDPQHAERVLLTGGDHMVYGPSLEHFQQKQKLRAYYRFMGVDFARYMIDGEQRMVVSGVRELPLYEPEPWLGYFGQRYMLFTHGFGLVMAPANEIAPDRGMEFVSYNIPGHFEWPEVALENERVYYGEGSATMAFSNVDRVPELDYPTDQDRAQLFLGSGETTAVAVDSVLKRLAFGWRSKHLIEFLFSNLITNDTRVHFYRRPIERLERIAPFLYFDTNPYAVSAEGEIQWMINGMTTSDRFPYSRFGELGDKSDQRSPYPVEHRWVNYVEDSVKAVVNAYSGEVSFYRISDDPVIETWARVYPDLFSDVSEMPESLRAHITYPPQFFHYQFDDMWIYYHMEDPLYFFNLEDMWDDADEVLGPIIDDGHAIRFSIEPYPLILEPGGFLPDAGTPTQYSMLLLFTPEKALNLRGIPIVYQDGDDYGRMAILEVPKGMYVLGPEQADSLIDQDPYISSQFALWSRRGMDIIRGHTFMIPFAEEVLYVEPIFKRSRQNPVTQLHKVAVVFRNRVAMADSLEEALHAIYERVQAEKPLAPVAAPEIDTEPEIAVEGTGRTEEEEA